MKKLLTLCAFLFIPIIAILFVQCSEQFVEPNDQETLNKYTKDNGGNMKNSGTKDYGDLIVCLRNVNGMPDYLEIPDEHDPYFPYAIKFEYDVDGILIPVEDGETYATFDRYMPGDVIPEGSVIGDIIPETGFYTKEIDLGRLSLVRAPESVLASALAEAISGLTQTGVTAIKTDASGRLVAIIGNEDWLVNFDDDPENDEDNDKTIDSPVENMAIYKELLTNELTGELSFLQKYFSDPFVLAVGALAAGADKTGNIMVDEIAYLNNWIIQWEWVDGEVVVYNENFLDYDIKGRGYLNYGVGGADFKYSREATYGNKYVKITTLNEGGTWEEAYVSLYEAVDWTESSHLINYSDNTYSKNTNITGFANAVDDAIQVLELIHSTDLIVYSPSFPLP